MNNRMFFGYSGVAFVIAVVCAASLAPPTHAEDGILSSSTSFHDVVLEALVARSQVQVGEFEYTVTFYAKAGDEFEWTKQGYFAFDDQEGRTTHSHAIVFSKTSENPNPYGGVVGDGIVEDTEEGLKYRGGGTVSRDVISIFPLQSAGGRLVSKGEASNFRLFAPFDYRSFGFALYGDLFRGKPFDKILSNYLVLDEKHIRRIKPKDLPQSFEASASEAVYFSHGGCVLCIEPSRDYWVTRSRLALPKFTKDPSGKVVKTGEDLQSDATVYIEKKNGLWVPVRALYKHGDRRLDFKINWLAVNPDEGEIDFSAENCAKRLKKALVQVN